LRSIILTNNETSFSTRGLPPLKKLEKPLEEDTMKE